MQFHFISLVIFKDLKVQDLSWAILAQTLSAPEPRVAWCPVTRCCPVAALCQLSHQMVKPESPPELGHVPAIPYRAFLLENWALYILGQVGELA